MAVQTSESLRQRFFSIHHQPRSDATSLVKNRNAIHEAWSEEELAKLAAERDAELESGAVSAPSHEAFLSGLRRPAGGA